MSDYEHVRVGVAIIARRGRAVLMGLRKGSHGAGTWSFPGGHLEKGEDVFHCAARELEEETGLRGQPSNFRKLTFTNDVFVVEGKHYITLYVEVNGEDLEGDLFLREPEKCAEWVWTPKEPEQLFLPIENLLKSGFEIWHGRRT